MLINREDDPFKKSIKRKHNTDRLLKFIFKKWKCIKIKSVVGNCRIIIILSMIFFLIFNFINFFENENDLFLVQFVVVAEV